MLKNISRLEHKIGDRVFHLLCDSDSPVHEAREALNEFMNFLLQIEENAKAAQEAQKQQEPVNERSEESQKSDEAS